VSPSPYFLMDESENSRGYNPRYDPEITSGDEPDTDAVKLLWPKNLPGFKDTLYEHHAQLLTLARTMVRTFALALHLEESYFDRYIEEPSAAMRITHYPQQDVSRFSRAVHNMLKEFRHLHLSNLELELTPTSNASHLSRRMSTQVWKYCQSRVTGSKPIRFMEVWWSMLLIVSCDKQTTSSCRQCIAW
jgi:hypothetical protein